MFTSVLEGHSFSLPQEEENIEVERRNMLRIIVWTGV